MTKLHGHVAADRLPANLKVIIVGASSRAAAQSARRAGFVVEAADLFADLDLLDCCPARQISRYPQEFGNVLRSCQADGWLYTGGLENYPELIDQWSQILPLWGNSGKVLRGIRSPQLVANCLLRAGLPCPTVETDPTRFAAYPTDGTWLLKPLKSAAGEGIQLWRGQAVPVHHYLQQRINGVAIAGLFLATNDRIELLGITKQLLEPVAATDALPTRYAGSIGPWPIAIELEQQFAQIGATLAAEFGLLGVFGIDAVANETGVWPVEVNPRYPASAEVFERNSGLSIVGCHVTAVNAAHPSLARRANGEMPTGEPEALAPGVCGKEIVYATTAITINIDLRKFANWIADVPAIGTKIPVGSPIATVLANGNSLAEVERLLQERSEQLLRFTLVDDPQGVDRRDIHLL